MVSMNWLARISHTFLNFFICSALLFAEEESFDLQVGKEHNEIIDQRENYFQTSTPYKITPKVNPLTGDLIEEETDLVIAGSELLSVRRFYNHTAIYEPRTATWRYNPETFFVANFEWPGQETFAAVGEANGSIAPFKPSSNTCTFNPKGFFNLNPSGQIHPLNTKIHYRKDLDKKKKGYFWWRGEIVDGSGRRRIFDSGKHCWLSDLITDVRRRHDTIYLTTCSPNCWTPYQLPIYEERKPNGNIISYTYTQWKENKYYPRPLLLNTITAYNANKTKNLGSITFHYHRDKHGDVRCITAVGSDGRQVTIQHQGTSPILLHATQTPDTPPITYGYQNGWVNRVEKPEGRLITTEYDQAGKVAAQYAPVGPNGEMHPIGRYVYHDKDTEVYDAEGNKTIYRFNEPKQILSLETYREDKLYRIDRLAWDPQTGNLLKKTIEDGSGRALQTTEYSYDKNHNPLLEKVGDGKEFRTIHRTFSDDGFNLKLSETDREGKLICYTYLPNTNLLTSELVYAGNHICKRTFHFYDDCAICIKTIIDDGHTEDPQNLQGITYRKITQITPKQKIPCFGLPEIIEEKTIDPSGNEIPLHKVIYTYTPFGKVLKEEHHDAAGTLRYTLFNAYDDKEHLISQTDQLGHKTTLTYDANNNLTSISGPKPGEHQEITYDKANRPTRIADWQTDGSILITEKKYDKLCRVIEEIDACKNKTQFQYDSLGRLIATIHPDGAIEHKEYDHCDHIIKEIDPEGYETRKTYNCFGQVLDITYPDSTTEHFTYHPTGTLATHTEKSGALSVYSYDHFDHPVKTATYSSSKQLLKKTTASWTPFRKLSETDGDLTITHTYDFAGRKTDEQKDFRQIHYVYDSLSRVQTTQEGNTELIEEHDLADQLIERRREKVGTLQSKEEYSYDERGNRTQVINSQGITQTLFDTDNKPLNITDPLGFTTQLIYSYKDLFTQTTIHPKSIRTLSIQDSRGRETHCLKKNTNNKTIQHYETIYDKNGNRTAIIHTIFSGIIPLKTLTHRWEYGPMGRIERFLEASERETRYLYDKKGRLKTLIKPNGKSLQHEYDERGRLTHFYADDLDYQYTYDLNDRVTSIYDNISRTTTTRNYDPLGNILEEKLANGLVFTNLYDKMGRRIQCVLPDSSNIDYTYDGHYLSQVKRGSYTHTYARRNLEGQIVKATLPDSQELSIARDKLGRYTDYQSPYYTASYPTYDGNGNLLQYQSHDPLGQVAYTFSYDDLDQLILERDHTYEFDSLYNRLSKDHLTYTLDAFCQINSDGQSTYTYDSCGNLTSDRIRYFYDSLDRLIALEDSNQRIEYTYDPFNRRLSKTVFSKGQRSPESLQWRVSDGLSESDVNHRGECKIKHIRYLWDGDNEIGSMDEKNRIQELRILGEGLGAEIGAAVLYELEGKSYMPIHDHRGCVVVLVDLQTQKPIESYRYTAFGEELTHNTFSPWRFASKRVDEETSLVFFGRRYYHPALGRWITQDPEGFEDGPNLYAYLKNSPLNDFDLYGLWSWGGMWGGTKDFFYGAGSYAWGGASGFGHSMAKMGEWMHADFQYEYFNDRSFFQDKSNRAVEGWKNLGRAAWDDPLGMVVPGVMEAWRNPTSPRAWGKAAVDIGLIGLSAAKFGGAAAGVGRVRRIGQEVTAFGQTRNLTSVMSKTKGVTASTSHLNTRFLSTSEGTLHDLKPTLDRIALGESFPHRNDGAVFKNFPPKSGMQSPLPVKPVGYYREFVHPTPGMNSPGSMRIVKGHNGEMWFTPDHYQTFIQIK
jgi:RHS repeat-associated protein